MSGWGGRAIEDLVRTEATDASRGGGGSFLIANHSLLAAYEALLAADRRYSLDIETTHGYSFRGDRLGEGGGVDQEWLRWMGRLEKGQQLTEGL